MGQYIITMPISENLALHQCRAKYVPDPETGGLRLASIQKASRPIFNAGFEQLFDKPTLKTDEEIEAVASSPGELVKRATRRAKERCFDYILCNDLDVFTTLTYSPDTADRESYEDVYKKLAVWLSNRVQRRGLRYVCVPEYHADGKAIHFHMLSTRDGLKLVDSGHFKEGKKVYNVADWNWGFSTALLVDGEDAREKVAKYIFKYMGKQMGQKIGGRYYLSGGKLSEPLFVYADDPAELGDVAQAGYHKSCDGDWGSFEEWSFL